MTLRSAPRTALLTLLVAGLAAPCVSTAAASPADVASGSALKMADLERAFDLAPGGVFEFRVRAADVVVRPAEGQQVRIRLELRTGVPAESLAQLWKVEAATPSRLAVEIEPESARETSNWRRLVNGLSGASSHPFVTLVRIEIPRGVRLTLATGAGDIDATHEGPDTGVTAGAGDVLVRSGGHGLTVHTGAGDVDLAAAGGKITVETGAGDVKLRLEEADFNVTTGAGDVTVTAARLVAPSVVVTGTGDVDVTLQAGGARLEAHGHPGDVRVDDACRTGQAGPALNLKTGGGDVTVSCAVHAN